MTRPSATSPALLTLLRGVGQPAQEARAALAGVDFAELARDAVRHALAAVVLEELERVELSPPPAAAERLGAQARTILAQGLQTRALLVRVLEALAAEDVVPVLLKGHGLAARLYPRPLARFCADVDVLVAPAELPRAERALAALGLRQQVDPGEHDVYADHHHLCFVGPPGAVDLHFRAFRGFGSAVLAHAHVAPGLWQGTFGAAPVRFLAPEDELVYLCAHAATHVFQRLGWLLDVALLLRRHPGLDRARVEETAARAQVGAALQVAGAALHTALHVSLPGRRKASGRAWLVGALLGEAQLVSGDLSRGRVSSFALRALMAERLSGVGRHVLKGALRASRRAILRRLPPRQHA